MWRSHPHLKTGDTCPACHGTGQRWLEQDCHRSGGWIPCRFSTSYKIKSKTDITGYVELQCSRGKLVGDVYAPKEKVVVEQSELYYVISTSEDGDVSISAYTKHEMENALDKKYWGDQPTFKQLVLGHDHDVAGRDGLYIIKGKLVTPVPKVKVEKWDI